MVDFNVFRDGGRYHIETSPLICSANQWTGFFMISTSVVKELTSFFTKKGMNNENITLAANGETLPNSCLFWCSKNWGIPQYKHPIPDTINISHLLLKPAGKYENYHSIRLITFPKIYLGLIFWFFSRFELIFAASAIFYDQVLFFAYVFCWNNYYILHGVRGIWVQKVQKNVLLTFLKPISNFQKCYKFISL